MNLGVETAVARTMRSFGLVVLLAHSACAGGSDTEGDGASTSGDESPLSEAQRLWNEQPEPPSHIARRYVYTPPQSCGQGPYEIAFGAEGSRFLEGFVAYACVRHRIGGDVRVITAGREPNLPSAYGYSAPENERCVATEAERARATESAQAPASTSTSSSTPPPSRPVRGGRGARDGSTGQASAAPQAGADTPTRAELPRSEATFEECPDGTLRVDIISMTYQSLGGPALAAGTHIGIELWSSVPNDLEGAVFVLAHEVSDADATAESFQAYRDALEDWRERYRAAHEAAVARGGTRVAARAVTETPPPPPRAETPPPRPSVNATWVPGYWHRADEWVFLPGFWRVPESDIERGLTVQAPEPPPPPRAETEETKGPSPSAEAVWTPGSWQWNGSAYVWVEGAYRIPPAAGQRWRPATWRARVRGSGAIFVPGGWTSGGR